MGGRGPSIKAKEEHSQGLQRRRSVSTVPWPEFVLSQFFVSVLMAEVVYHFFPKLVELHNYGGTNATEQKKYNWSTLNQKVFKKIGFQVQKADIEAMCLCKPGAVERVLKLVKYKIAAYREGGGGDVVGDQTAPSSKSSTFQEKKALPSKTSAPVAVPQQAAKPIPFPNVSTVTNVSSEADKREIAELKETNDILETKVRKLEQLVRLKDAKIQTLQAKLSAAGLDV